MGGFNFFGIFFNYVNFFNEEIYTNIKVVRKLDIFIEYVGSIEDLEYLFLLSRKRKLLFLKIKILSW